MLTSFASSTTTKSNGGCALAFVMEFVIADTFLEDHHLTPPEAHRIAWNLHEAGTIKITNAQPREKSAKDGHLLVLPDPKK